LWVAISLVVVDDFDIGGPFLGPGETGAPLVVDPDRMLAAAVPGQRFEPVGWRRAQIIEVASGMEHVKQIRDWLLDLRWQLHWRTHRWRGAAGMNWTMD
jgi:hypothetical protein